MNLGAIMLTTEFIVYWGEVPCGACLIRLPRSHFMGVCLARSACNVCQLDDALAVEESSACPVWLGMLV